MRAALAYLGKPEALLLSVMDTKHTLKNILGGLALTTPFHPLLHTPSVHIAHCLWPGSAQVVGKGAARAPRGHN